MLFHSFIRFRALIIYIGAKGMEVKSPEDLCFRALIIYIGAKADDRQNNCFYSFRTLIFE